VTIPLLEKVSGEKNECAAAEQRHLLTGVYALYSDSEKKERRNKEKF
jgi:hypothetical protein